MSKIRAIWRLGVNYIKHDLKEIIAPSSLPNPPGYKPPPPLTLRKAFERFRGALQGYIATWNPEKLQEELRKRGEADDVDDVGTKAELQGVLDDLSMSPVLGILIKVIIYQSNLIFIDISTLFHRCCG